MRLERANNPKTMIDAERLTRATTMVSDGADPKIRIYDAGMKKYSCDAFPACVHLVRYVLGRERSDAFATRKQTLLGRARVAYTAR